MPTSMLYQTINVFAAPLCLAPTYLATPLLVVPCATPLPSMTIFPTYTTNNILKYSMEVKFPPIELTIMKN